MGMPWSAWGIYGKAVQFYLAVVVATFPQLLEGRWPFPPNMENFPYLSLSHPMKKPPVMGGFFTVSRETLYFLKKISFKPLKIKKVVI